MKSDEDCGDFFEDFQSEVATSEKKLPSPSTMTMYGAFFLYNRFLLAIIIFSSCSFSVSSCGHFYLIYSCDLGFEPNLADFNTVATSSSQYSWYDMMSPVVGSRFSTTFPVNATVGRKGILN